MSVWIEVDLAEPHDWLGPGVYAYGCCAEDGLHICMRGASIDGRPQRGPHRCACGHRWPDAER